MLINHRVPELRRICSLTFPCRRRRPTAALASGGGGTARRVWDGPGAEEPLMVSCLTSGDLRPTSLVGPAKCGPNRHNQHMPDSKRRSVRQ